jgi:DNA-binding CsgD family transcriptional regulator
MTASKTPRSDGKDSDLSGNASLKKPPADGLNYVFWKLIGPVRRAVLASLTRAFCKQRSRTPARSESVRYVESKLVGTRYVSESTKTSTPQPMTPMETKVVRLVSLGCTTLEVAAILGTKESTVDNHRWRAMKKLGVGNGVTLTRAAIASGITSMGDCLTDAERAKSEPRGSRRGRYRDLVEARKALAR